MRPSPWSSACWAAKRTASLGSSSSSSSRCTASAMSTRSRFSAARARTVGFRSPSSTTRRGSPSGSSGQSAAAWARRRQRRLRRRRAIARPDPVAATSVRSRSSASPSRSAARRWVMGSIIEVGSTASFSAASAASSSSPNRTVDRCVPTLVMRRCARRRCASPSAPMTTNPAAITRVAAVMRPRLAKGAMRSGGRIVTGPAVVRHGGRATSPRTACVRCRRHRDRRPSGCRIRRREPRRRAPACGRGPRWGGGCAAG